MGFELAWYVLTVSPLCEKAVARRLKRRFGGVPSADAADGGELIAPDLATYVPTLKRQVRRRGSRYVIEQVLLPRYLFVGFALSEQEGLAPPPWLHVFEVLGVQGVLGFNGTPYRIDATIVGDLIARSMRGVFDQEPPATVQRGMRVVATGGTLRDFEGDVVNINKGSNTAQVLFELFDGSMPTTMSLDDLVSVSYSSRRMIG